MLGNHGTSKLQTAMILIKKLIIYDNVNELFVNGKPFFCQERKNWET